MTEPVRIFLDGLAIDGAAFIGLLFLSVLALCVFIAVGYIRSVSMPKKQGS